MAGMTNGNGQEQRQPPELGDVHLLNTRRGWQLWQGGRLVCEGLTTKQALQLIRGERTVSELLEAAGGHR